MSAGRLWKVEGCFHVHDKVFVPLEGGSERGIAFKRGNDHLELEHGILHPVESKIQNKDIVARYCHLGCLQSTCFLFPKRLKPQKARKRNFVVNLVCPTRVSWGMFRFVTSITMPRIFFPLASLSSNASLIPASMS